MSSDSKRDLALAETGLLSPEQLASLDAHWVTTLEQLFTLGASDERRRSGAELLGMERADFDDLIGRAKALAPEIADAAVAYPYEDFLGCLAPLAEAAPTPLPALAADVTLPDEADLRPALPPVRDQGRRGTCVAHAVAAVRECLTGRTDHDLSEQFLYWACKERDEHPGSGTYLVIGMAALLEDGICLEEEWPYNPNPIDGNEGQGPPPPGATVAAETHRAKGIFCLVGSPRPPTALYPFKFHLGGDAPRPVAISVPLFDSFFNQATRRTGRVIMPLPGEDLRGGHAMCIVGYQDEPSVPGGGFFIVRNSWGEGWAFGCDYGAGHALIPYEYLRQHCWEAYTCEADPVAGPARARRPKEKTARFFLEHGTCGACGKTITTILDIAGQCTAPGCNSALCNTCWTLKRRRRCTQHADQEG